MGIGGTNSHLSLRLGVPGNLGDSSFDLVRVFEDHNGFGADVLRQVLGLLSLEVLFKQIDLVVLSDAVNGTGHQVTSGRGESEVLISVESLHVLGHIRGLGVVSVLGPS